MIRTKNHPWIVHLVRLRDDRKYREGQTRLLVSGAKLIDELISDHELKIGYTLKYKDVFGGVPGTELVHPDIAAHVTQESRSEGVFAEVTRKNVLSYIPAKASRGVILYNISDPGNMGSLIRTSHAFGWDFVGVFGKNCVDPFSYRCIRSSRGSIFRIPLVRLKPVDLHLWTLYGADLSGRNYEDAPLNEERLGIVLGSESHGLKDFPLSLSPITIPMVKSADSLNVTGAGAILLNHFKKKNLLQC